MKRFVLSLIAALSLSAPALACPQSDTHILGDLAASKPRGMIGVCGEMFDAYTAGMNLNDYRVVELYRLTDRAVNVGPRLDTSLAAIEYRRVETIEKENAFYDLYEYTPFSGMGARTVLAHWFKLSNGETYIALVSP